jgi:predicted AlkP superfamily pyrophosphatase or phosphodiesterase
VFAYYHGIDYVAHRFGLITEFFAAELTHADRLVGDLLEVLPPEAVLVVTSDHGQVQLSGHLPLDPIKHLVGTAQDHTSLRRVANDR